MAKTFGTNFLAGLVSGGLGTYLKLKDVERADAREKRDQEAADYLKEQRGRESARQRDIDAAMADLSALETSGKTVVDNTSGFSPSDVTRLMGQGGQQAVDAEATRIANAEMEAGGAPSKVSSMIPNFNDPAGAAVQGAPTVAMRDATNVDRIGALQRIAIASRDAGAIERLGQAKMQAKFDQDDMAKAMAVMKDPTGAQAQELVGMVQSSIPGASLGFDQASGNFVGSIGNKAVSMSPAQLGQLAVAQNQFLRGDPRALATVAGIDKDLAAVAAGRWKTQLEMAKFTQDAQYKGAQITHLQNQDTVARGNLANNTATTQANVAQTQAQTAEIQRKAAQEAEARGLIGRLYKAKNPNASDDEVMAASLRVLDGQDPDKNAPAEVKLASAMVKFGVAPDMKAALERAMSSKEASPDKLRADIYKSALTANFGDAKKAEETVNQFMIYMGQFGKPGTSNAQAVTPSSVTGRAGPPAGTVSNGFRFKGGNPNDKANWEPVK